MICSSLMPTACMRAMRSLAGLEKLHSSMLHVATESLQPHWHVSRLPTRRTSGLGFSAAVCARATAAGNSARQPALAGAALDLRSLAISGLTRPASLPLRVCVVAS